MKSDPDDATKLQSFFYQPAGERRDEGDSQAPRSLTPGTVVGHYTLTRFIARGGMGQVWAAEDSKLRTTVALKLVLPDRVDERSLELFAREARAGGRLRHPNIVSTLGFGSEDQLSWIAQELIDGSWTLKDFIDATRSAEEVPKGYYRRVAELVAQLADALGAAHEAGVIHRDVKPANVLIAPDDTPKLTDFGLARVSGDSIFSGSGDLAGTWAYMSPEQVTAKRMGLDHRSDVFSLGVVLYELLALRRPFDGDTTHQIAEQIITHEPPDPSKVRSQCPRELAIICAKALEKAPSKRYESMADFASDLRRHLANEPIAARPIGPLGRAIKWTLRNPTAAAVGAVVTLALLVVSGLLSHVVGVQRDLDVSVDRLNEVQRDIASLQGSREALNSELKSAEIELDSSTDELLQLKSRIERSDKEAAESSQRADSLIGQLDELRAERDRTIGSLEALRATVNEKDQERAQAEARLLSLEAELGSTLLVAEGAAEGLFQLAVARLDPTAPPTGAELEEIVALTDAALRLAPVPVALQRQLVDAYEACSLGERALTAIDRFLESADEFERLQLLERRQRIEASMSPSATDD